MKRFCLSLVVFFLTLGVVQAALVFDKNKKYRIECPSSGLGNLVIGANHGSTAILFYEVSNTCPSDGWWYIRAGQQGWNIINAQSGEYITYDENRIPQVAKGLILTSVPRNTDSEWLIEEMNDYLVIKSVSHPYMWFNLRRDGSNLMGTYTGSGSGNELFNIYDERGNNVKDGDIDTPGHVSALSSVLDSLRINDKHLVFDVRNKEYIFPLNPSLRNGGDLVATLTCKFKAGYENYVLKINGEVPQTDTHEFTIPDVNCEGTYQLEVFNEQNELKAQSRLRFTFLPLVEVNVSSCNGQTYTRGNIRVTDPVLVGHDSVFVAAFKYRGATAQRFSKKSYAIKLKNAKNESVDRSFLGLRSDNNWILDAMAVDRACMRNRVSTDLWNDFSVPPYYKDREPKALTGTRGKFVEVLLNGQYHGVYCMTEKIDRKQLKLKKFKPAALSPTQTDLIRGLLYKSKQWSYEVFMGHEQDRKELPGRNPDYYNNQLGRDYWCNYEIKYPDYEEEAVEWGPLYEAVKFVATTSQLDFESGLNSYFDYQNLRDYYLFCELLLATDNHGKNVYFYVYDMTGPERNKMGLAPWDLDGTWGARWDGSYYLTGAKQDFDEFLWNCEHGQHTIYMKLQKSRHLTWQDDLTKRYAELRGTYFQTEKLAARFADYMDLFVASGADLREETRWGDYHSGMALAVEYVKQWIEERIATLDEKYGYDPLMSSVNEAVADDYFNVTGGNGQIGITAGKAQRIRIYTLSGALVRQVDLSSGFNVVKGLPAGVYLVGNRKVLVKP